MAPALVPIDPALVALIHGSFGQNGGLMPFAREIMLIECPIAGTSHRDLTGLEASLTPGTFLPLQREPENPHDALAIRIHTEAGRHLGYIPRAKNEAAARLMDAGKLLFARLEFHRWDGAYLAATIRVYLRDL